MATSRSTISERLQQILSSAIERGDIPGGVALVSRRGQVDVEAAGNLAMGQSSPMTRDTIFRIASMTKPVTAVAAMILVEDCKLRLDEPIDSLVPELADRRVLKRIDGDIDDTDPASRSITVRDLLTMRMGLGYLMQPDTGSYPIMKAARERGILVGPPRPQEMPPPDEWIRRLGELPLMHHPGERWMYDVSHEVLGVVVARAAGMPLDQFFTERIFSPLGMHDTSFSVPESKIERLATSYWTNFETGAFEVFDPAKGGQWSRPPAFCSAAGGLVSTVDDYARFGRMMLGKGVAGGVRILSRATVDLMTTDQLTDSQKVGAEIFLGPSLGWGLGMAIITRREGFQSVGTYTWNGGLGTMWAVDPAEELFGVLLTQSAFTSPVPPKICVDFSTAAYAAIDD